MLVIWSVFFFDKVKIDDPVGAISVHGVNGALGRASRSACSRTARYGAGWNGVGATDYLGVAGQGVTGLFYGDSKQLIAQLIEVGVGIALERGRRRRRLLRHRQGRRLNRVSAEVEIAGLDVPEMGRRGYPEFLKPRPEEVAAPPRSPTQGRVPKAV